jgi:aminopeptidase N
MKKTLLLFLSLTTLSVFSQDQKGTCSGVKRHVNSQAKSNSFSVAQIAETEKYDVHFYYLNLNMTNTSTSLSGFTEIHATCRQNLDSALVELFPSFVISSIEVDGSPVGYNRTNTALKIPVNKTSGQNFVLHINYAGTPPTAATNPLGGGGMTNASSPTWGNQVTWSLSEPFSAMEWFPVKQSLTDKADSCAVWITVPNTCKAGSNGVLEQVVDLGNGTQRFEWKHRHPIAYYLISVAVAQYVEYNVTANPAGSGPVLIQNYIYNNPQTLTNFQNDIDETVDFLELFASQFGPYPFANEKYGHCMAPISGGMEHQTMTTQGFFTPTLTAHELAHQWFGDHVTCKSWADIWVNEGFASYAEYLMLENLYAGQQQQDMLTRHQEIMSTSGGSVYVLDSLNDGAIFDSRLVYDKGAAIIHTLRYLINDDAQFFQALQNYQSQFADSTALATDVMSVFETVTGKDFTNFMQEWYYGEGYPTYSVRWNVVGNDALVEINHTTSKPSVTPTFTNDLDLRFSRTGMSDTIIRFGIYNNQSQFIVPNAANFLNVNSIDPNNWIINKNGSIVKDGNFTVGINENSATEAVLVYPNPTADVVRIEVMHDSKLVVIDPTGRVLFQQTATSGTQIDLSTYASGTYIFQLTDLVNQSRTVKLIRKK